MTDESTPTDESASTDHPYRIDGVPPLPFEENTGDDRGETVWAVMDLGRPQEDATVDRVFYDAESAQHHADRIQNEDHIPSMVIRTQIE
jgi:hypothetical protein